MMEERDENISEFGNEAVKKELLFSEQWMRKLYGVTKWDRFGN